MKIRVTIDKIENGYLMNVPDKDEHNDIIEYSSIEYAYTTLDECIEKVKEVYGSLA